MAGIAGIIYFWTESWSVLTGIALVTLLPFILLIKYHNRLFHRKDYLEKEAEVNRQELAALDYDTSCFDGGTKSPAALAGSLAISLAATPTSSRAPGFTMTRL